jgi:hypothetical protein
MISPFTCNYKQCINLVNFGCQNQNQNQNHITFLHYLIEH